MKRGSPARSCHHRPRLTGGKNLDKFPKILFNVTNLNHERVCAYPEVML